MEAILRGEARRGLNEAADFTERNVIHPMPEGVRPGVLPARTVARGVAASGRIHFWESGSVWIGAGRGRTERHEHHAHQIALALDGSFRFRARPDGDWVDFDGVIVPSHCPHEFELDAVLVAHLFVEPESVWGRALSERYDRAELCALPADAVRAAAAKLVEAWHGHADAQAFCKLARSTVARFAGTDDGPPAGNDIRLDRALAFIRSRIRTPVTLAEAAAAATLSPSRFRHLFVEQTGASFRAYLLWQRINVAIEAAGRGASWTDAAHEAGFADSAHLSRTHRRMFGIEPTAIRRDADQNAT